MKVLVTGATGLVGNAIARRLHAGGHEVRTLVRQPDRVNRKWLPEGIELVRGDITEPATLEAAVRGVERVFHAAGMPEQWQADDGIFDRVNRAGTANVLAAARAAGVARVIWTGTIDLFAAARGGTLVETHVDTARKPTAYERSKQDALGEVEAARARGLDVVSVCPSGVYGPSPVLVGMNRFLSDLVNGKVPALPPGGLSLVYVDGVTDVHLAAAERGKDGEHYIVSDAYASVADLARDFRDLAGIHKSLWSAPEGLAKALAGISAPIARTFGVKPLLAAGELSFFLWQARADASKAQRELGFQPTPLRDGLAKTLAFLREEGHFRG